MNCSRWNVTGLATLSVSSSPTIVLTWNGCLLYGHYECNLMFCYCCAPLMCTSHGFPNTCGAALQISVFYCCSCNRWGWCTNQQCQALRQGFGGTDASCQAQVWARSDASSAFGLGFEKGCMACMPRNADCGGCTCSLRDAVVSHREHYCARRTPGMRWAKMPPISAIPSAIQDFPVLGTPTRELGMYDSSPFLAIVVTQSRVCPF